MTVFARIPHEATEREKLNFAEAEARARRLSDSSLDWNIRDLRETIEIQERATREGTMLCPKLGYYRDELNVYVTERYRRAKGKGRKARKGRV